MSDNIKKRIHFLYFNCISQWRPRYPPVLIKLVAINANRCEKYIPSKLEQIQLLNCGVIYVYTLNFIMKIFQESIRFFKLINARASKY